MGNSKNAAGCQISSGPNANAGNGILVYVPNDQVAAAVRLLPLPKARGQVGEVVMEVEDFGPVRFFARVCKGSHRGCLPFWAVYRAERVGTDELPV
ncbi:hypothetical protein [Cupriavidus necator]|uniref:hypothetical protein n=1 Tax=Cupriavidus necator TaxID=106590 RepID=UPI000045F87F|nr:hypothetical protein [Cupriavidus necator]